MLTKSFDILQASGCAVIGYFHDWYYTRKDPRNTMLYLTNLKNDIPPYHTPDVIRESEAELAQVIRHDFADLVSAYGAMTVCGVPRSKRERSYPFSQMGLKRTIRAVTRELGMEDGMDYIVRHTDTVCTHRARSGHGGAGEMPRPGLLKDTCFISPCIAGKDILLVDDIYTPGVGIDEDAIRALLDCGAKNVIFYAVGYTAKGANYYRYCA